MIRLGIVDFDTSHAVEFTKRLNHVGIADDQWVEGAKVVAGVPGTSAIAPQVIPKNLETLKGYGVEILDDPAALFGKIDAVLIEAVDGSVHLARAMPFLERGIPTYVDKPFACSLADARTMMNLAMSKHIPMMSSSSLRYAPEIVAAAGGKGPLGAIIGATTYGPCELHPRNPGMFHYGIHAVEMLFTLMGSGCKKVSCVSEPGADVATGVWSDGRVATVRGLRAGSHDYGFTVFGEKGIKTEGVGTKYIYRELLKKIVGMFETKQVPIDPRETLEIVGFIESALKSSQSGGAMVEIKV